jgi:hypothetical protein
MTRAMNATFNGIPLSKFFACVEPAKLSDCPHKPGTPDHAAWIREHVLECQGDPRTQANQNERARISNLVSNRAEQLNTERAQRTAALDAMIADLPDKNWRLPPKTFTEVLEQRNISLTTVANFTDSYLRGGMSIEAIRIMEDLPPQPRT